MSISIFGVFQNGTLYLHSDLTISHFDGITLEPIIFSTLSTTSPEATTKADLSCQSTPQTVIVDAAKVKRCDSVGIAALLWLLQQARAQNIKMQFIHLSSKTEQLLKLYELNFIETS